MLPSPSHDARQASAVSPQRELLKERAFRELRTLIQTGDWTAESALSERQLAERLGMSKTPVRAALENLESQGLVTVTPQKGILVRELSARETAELFDVRSAVEPFVAAQLARTALTAPQRETISTNLREQRLVADARDSLAATRQDIAFHRLLADLLENREIAIWLERCFDRLHRSILRVNRLVPGRLHRSCDDHVAIASAILEGRADEAARAMTEHLSFGRRFLLGGETSAE
jgi:DNA-binding GntR family transcriptional regulator